MKAIFVLSLLAARLASAQSLPAYPSKEPPVREFEYRVHEFNTPRPPTLGRDYMELRNLRRMQSPELRVAIDEEIAGSLTQSLLFATAPSIAMLTMTPTLYLQITVGKGFVQISFKDGSVEFTDCEPDEAARQFWFKVSAAFPYFRNAILAEAHK